ncbi:MAG: HAMP domain-containing histidine kinase [Comamonadaceae bacterium]|nr:MAG: HAMP domain-containing histidine kinase [Comamonadaceae bacterium]
MQWLHKEVVAAPLAPVLHPSPLRMKGLGLFTLVGHPLFYVVWAIWLPQPYENLWLRCATALLGCLLMLKWVARDPSSRHAGLVFTAVFWLELPLLFSWMYLSNGGNTVWLASVCTMVAIYYYVTDWRIATSGLALGALLAWLLFQWLGPSVAPMTPEQVSVNSVAILFSISMGLLLGVSSANLRREQLVNTLTTMGIMAHELRTPLSTAALLGDALQLEVQRMQGHASTANIDKLAVRLHALVRNMNRQIDTQIANAKLLQLPRFPQRVTAARLVRETIDAYPYPATRQRDCVRVVVREDFVFRGSPAQFSQVLDNLIKNALHSLMAADSRYPPFALRILVAVDGDRGRIVVEDDGMGIESSLVSQIFQPFFSSNRSTGHGLGLAFCQQVVRAAGGNITVKSAFAVGAAFTIELPVAEPARAESLTSH